MLSNFARLQIFCLAYLKHNLVNCFLNDEADVVTIEFNFPANDEKATAFINKFSAIKEKYSSEALIYLFTDIFRINNIIFPAKFLPQIICEFDNTYSLEKINEENDKPTTLFEEALAEVIHKDPAALLEECLVELDEIKIPNVIPDLNKDPDVLLEESLLELEEHEAQKILDNSFEEFSKILHVNTQPRKIKKELTEEVMSLTFDNKLLQQNLEKLKTRHKKDFSPGFLIGKPSPKIPALDLATKNLFSADKNYLNDSSQIKDGIVTLMQLSVILLEENLKEFALQYSSYATILATHFCLILSKELVAVTAQLTKYCKQQFDNFQKEKIADEIKNNQKDLQQTKKFIPGESANFANQLFKTFNIPNDIRTMALEKAQEIFETTMPLKNNNLPKLNIKL